MSQAQRMYGEHLRRLTGKSSPYLRSVILGRNEVMAPRSIGFSLILCSAIPCGVHEERDASGLGKVHEKSSAHAEATAVQNGRYHHRPFHSRDFAVFLQKSVVFLLPDRIAVGTRRDETDGNND